MEAEVQGYLTELDKLRKQTRDAIQGLNDEAANWRPLPQNTNSIYAILCHLAGAENYWVRQIIGGETIKRDKEAELSASGHLSEIVDRWEEVSRANEGILSKLNSAQLGESRIIPVRPDWGSIPVRGCILHLISHYAIHLGHIQLTRQWWEQR